jgi:FlaA1/EpsC-like NDP-sugar epimerase
VATAACEHNVQKFVLISTDKAVRPTSIMGATKRLAELILQSLDKECQQTTFAMVRFGNVLGSSGSVVPLFLKQIREGGPVTVTHRDVTRYFMTITEAAQLVIQAGAMTNADADPDAAKSSGAPLYLLDMGEPVRIVDLAKRMIELSGFTVFDELDRKDGDIEIREIGLRAGEKLHEELLISSEVSDTSHPKIKVAVEEFMSWTEISNLLSELQNAVSQQNEALLREIIANHFDGISRH